jgi:hypothetical protein
MPRTLAFDIGIKNLAWCCGDLSGSHLTIRGWSNENLITGQTAEEDSDSNRCFTCSKKSGFWHIGSGRGYCVRHCPSLTPALRDLSGVVLKKLPKLGLLKEIAQRNGAEKKDLKSKDTTVKFLETHYCFPKPPAPKATRLELEGLHEGIRSVVLRNRELFQSCDEILLENQPVYKNPVMKSIQMMLFATLRDILREQSGMPPKVRLVHAGKKTAGATKGDEGYAERKSASETRIQGGLTKGTIVMACADRRDALWFSKQSKKSDLADCCSMVLDSAGGAASK